MYIDDIQDFDEKESKNLAQILRSFYLTERRAFSKTDVHHDNVEASSRKHSIEAKRLE